jgi:hypothetical protein
MVEVWWCLALAMLRCEETCWRDNVVGVGAYGGLRVPVSYVGAGVWAVALT